VFDAFLFENLQLLASLEELLLRGESNHMLDGDEIGEVFRIMHTLKGSFGMMSFDRLAALSHSVEDLFAQIRGHSVRRDDWDMIFELILASTDTIKSDMLRFQSGESDERADVDYAALTDSIRSFLQLVAHGDTDDGEPPAVEAIPESVPESVPEDTADETPLTDIADALYYKITVTFESDCQMENIRAFSVVNELTPLCRKLSHKPSDLLNDDAAVKIVSDGFLLYVCTSAPVDALRAVIDDAMFVQSVAVTPLDDDSAELPESLRPPKKRDGGAAVDPGSRIQFISVNVTKLDTLLDLVGEIITAEAMVTKNPALPQIHADGFDKSVRQLQKLIGELQDVVISVRMVPVKSVFQKMRRIVRDISKKEGKPVEFTLIGEDTEVDKNIIDTLSDPLMHLIRNAVDHGIEPPETRAALGKSPTGQITLEAHSSGGDVTITLTDDGGGLDSQKIARKAIEKGLTIKPLSDITDKDAAALILLPGFSTNDAVTEYSGRGVGLDVVKSNIDSVGGSISIDSKLGYGTTVTLRIPLTLAIMDGMLVRVGDARIIIPITAIRESFRPDPSSVIRDPDGGETVIVRGDCYPVVRLHERFAVEPTHRAPGDAILVMVSTAQSTYCLMADELIGDRQTVIKPLPPYIRRYCTVTPGISGCAVLGDGAICLIVDVNGLRPPLSF
jgi:two-component system chemotaxis sensor kinase CheA